MNKIEFYEALNKLEINVDDTLIFRLEHYKDLIQEVNKVLNLTAIDDDAGIYLKHFYDSALVHRFIEEGSSLCDVGSGAGFPGIVLAIVRPDIHVTCIEPTTKRTNFLERVVEECKLDNVKVVNERAEDAIVSYRESFDVATARAVAYLDILAELCVPFVRVGGTFLAMKGAKGEEELMASTRALKTLGVELKESIFEYHEGIGERINYIFEKISKTPLKYPRNYGKIKKTPLSGRKNG